VNRKIFLVTESMEFEDIHDMEIDDEFAHKKNSDSIMSEKEDDCARAPIRSPFTVNNKELDYLAEGLRWFRGKEPRLVFKSA
jgi:hypothetical protein